MVEFTVVSKVSKLPPGGQKEIDVVGESILLVNIDGSFYAMGNICTHIGCPLLGGSLEGKIITCACHGSQFDITTGEVVKGPADEPEPTYEVKLDGENILVGRKKGQ